MSQNKKPRPFEPGFQDCLHGRSREGCSDGGELLPATLATEHRADAAEVGDPGVVDNAPPL
jgi:hypothetical protein